MSRNPDAIVLLTPLKNSFRNPVGADSALTRGDVHSREPSEAGKEVSREGSITAEQVARLIAMSAGRRVASGYPRGNDYQPTYRKAPEDGNVQAKLDRWAEVFAAEAAATGKAR